MNTGPKARLTSLKNVGGLLDVTNQIRGFLRDVT